MVQVERHRLGALPATLAERLLADAMAKWVTIFSVKIFDTCQNIVRYDNQLGIQRLLLAYLVLVGSVGPLRSLSTPLYLYHWHTGRIL